jgi:hypothetical protein
MQFPPISYNFVTLRSKYSPQQPTPTCLQSVFRPSYKPIQDYRKIVVLYTVILTLSDSRRGVWELQTLLLNSQSRAGVCKTKIRFQHFTCINCENTLPMMYTHTYDISMIVGQFLPPYGLDTPCSLAECMLYWGVACVVLNQLEITQPSELHWNTSWNKVISCKLISTSAIFLIACFPTPDT